MTHPWRILGMSGGAALALSGCAGMADVPPTALRVEPVLRVTQSVASGEAYYTTGRYYDGMQQHARAVDAYRKAVAADARNVEAHNALGVALARLGQYEAAEAALRQGLLLDPSRAHVRSNLGHALMLGGRTPEAIVELQAAVSMDPSDTTARGNLDQAIAISGGGRPAVVAVSPPHQRSEVPLATSSTITAPSTPAAHWVANDRPTALAWSAEAVTKAPLPTPMAATPATHAVLELTNGNGVTGAAAHMRQWLAAHGVPTSRLTNLRPYNQQRTIVQYRVGQEAAAHRLAQLLPPGTEVLAVHRLRTDVRLVLGRDWDRLVGCVQQATCRDVDRLAATAQANR